MFCRKNSVALEERRNELNEKILKKEKKDKKKKKKKKEKDIPFPESDYSSEYTPDSCSSDGSPHLRRNTEPDIQPLGEVEEEYLNHRRHSSGEVLKPRKHKSKKHKHKMADTEPAVIELASENVDDSPAPVSEQSAEDSGQPSEDALAEIEAEEKKEAEAKKRQREPPIIFKDAINVSI